MVLTLTTELEAINKVLQMSGEAPVSSTVGQVGIAKQAQDALNSASREVQSEGWSFNTDYEKTLKICHSTVGVAILNTSITIVFGFSILVLSKFIPTIYFGIFTGIAMLLAMISVLTLLPSLILLIKPFNKF